MLILQTLPKYVQYDSGAVSGSCYLTERFEQDKSNLTKPNADLEKRENELKEKALRNKVVRTRKGSNGAS